MVLAWVKYDSPQPSLDTAQVVTPARDHSQQAFGEGRRIRRMDVGHLVPAGLHIKAHLTFYCQ